MGKKDKERRVYPKEFKAEAVALAQKHEKPVCQVTADVSINENLLHRWRRLKGNDVSKDVSICFELAPGFFISTKVPSVRIRF
jgi:transposase-like protein